MSAAPKWDKDAFALPADGVALDGYDPVAYFTAGKPTRGLAALEASWHGATWRFASPANRATFLAEPERYAPQLGGYCGFAVALSDRPNVPAAPRGSPRWWSLHDGQLYLNANPVAWLLFRLMRLRERADGVWHKLAA